MMVAVAAVTVGAIAVERRGEGGSGGRSGVMVKEWWSGGGAVERRGEGGAGRSVTANDDGTCDGGGEAAMVRRRRECACLLWWR